MRATKLITISLPAELLDETQRVARQEDRSRSDLIREALRQYLASADGSGCGGGARPRPARLEE